MPRISIDGRSVDVEEGITVAAALLNAGITSFRTSVRGEPRAPLCGMGVCHECRVTVDGTAHVRSCLTVVTDGMTVTTGAPVPPQLAESAHLSHHADVVVIGAGPAGIAAAVTASSLGARVVLIDESARVGGQIWRHRNTSSLPRVAVRWMERLARSSVVSLANTTVTNVEHADGGLVVHGQRGSARVSVSAARLVLATGARERFLPFPGSTLPMVIGVGAAQALLKSGASFAGRHVVVAGTGPLLLPVAAALAADGAQLTLVAEQARFASVARFASGLWRHPSSLVQAARYRSAFAGTPYRTGMWVTGARGNGRVQEVDVTRGTSTRTLHCDVLCVSHGLVANTELARLLGCEVRDGAVAVDDYLRTSVAGIYSAGEATGVGGMELALAEGEVAGADAAGSTASARGRQPVVKRLRNMARRMDTAFALRPELRALAAPGATMCRCEDVQVGALQAGWTNRTAKLYTRAGMGPCQGRICGPALEYLHGGSADSVRLPIQPVQLNALAPAAPAATYDGFGEQHNG